MIQIIQNAFRHRNGIAAHLPYLRQSINQVVQELSKHEQLLIYLTDIRKKSEYLYGHCVDVGVFAVVIGMVMGLSKEEICTLGLGGLLHDYGKTVISDDVLEKNGPLTLEEFEFVKAHALEGYKILCSEAKLDYHIALIALQHHERPDGGGYPWGAKAAEIHPLARIVAVADVYDALTTDRVYRPAVSVFEAVKIIQAGRGTQFDPIIVDVFCNITVPFNIGSSVKLSSGISGAVLKINSSNPTRPVVWTRTGTINLIQEPAIHIVDVI
jgi:HD-GYP domain-containing protein (c-di-GMP phosphodiesterase class II)